MSVWHVTPDYIVNNWTDELLDLMVEKLVERKQRESGTIQESGNGSPKNHSVSAETLSAMSGGLIKVIKKDGD